MSANATVTMRNASSPPQGAWDDHPASTPTASPSPRRLLTIADYEYPTEAPDFQKSQNAVNAAWHRRPNVAINVTQDTQLRIQYSRSSLTSSSQGCTSSTTVAQASARAPTIHLLSPSSALAWASHQRTHNTRRSDSDRRRPPRGEDSSDDDDYCDECYQPNGYAPDHYGDDERSGSTTKLSGEDRALEASKAHDPLQAHTAGLDATRFEHGHLGCDRSAAAMIIDVSSRRRR